VASDETGREPRGGERRMMGPTPQAAPAAQAPSAQGTTVLRNAVNLVMGQAATTFLAVALNAVLGRSLGAADFGLYFLITTMSTFAYVFVEWGQPIYVIRRVAQAPSMSGELVGAALALRAVLAPLAAAAAFLVAYVLGYDIRTRWLAFVLILANLPLFLSQGFGMVFRAFDRMGRDAAVSVSNKALVLCMTLPALALGAGIPGVIVAQGLAGVVALLVAVALYRRMQLGAMRLSSSVAWEVLAGGAPVLAMTAATSVQSYLDAIILSKLAPATVVGWFGAARSLLGTIMAPAVILGAASYPTLARASVDPALFSVEVRRAFRPLVWLAALAGTGTFLFARVAIDIIYGVRGFGPAQMVLEVFAPGFVLLFIDILLGNIIFACGRGSGFTIAKIASVAVGAGLDVLLVPRFQEHFGNGGIGVIVAFALSEFVVFAGCVVILPRGVLGRGTALDVARAIGSAAVTLALFRLLPGLPPWAGIPLCVVVYTAASVALGLVGSRDLVGLWSFIRPGRTPAP